MDFTYSIFYRDMEFDKEMHAEAATKVARAAWSKAKELAFDWAEVYDECPDDVYSSISVVITCEYLDRGN